MPKQTGARSARTTPSEPSARSCERREEIISEELGLKLENTTVAQLGTAKTVKVDKDMDFP